MNKEKWIDEILQSGRNIVPIEANPFLHTRIESRLQQESPASRIQPRWIYALTTVMTIALVFNIYAWFNTQQDSKPSGIQQVMQEYGWENSDNYSMNFSK